MHAKMSFVFWITLILYLVTLFTVSYVGVYLTYVAIPVLIVSGLLMKCLTPKSEHKKIIDDGKTTLKEAGKITNEVLNGVNGVLGDLNRSLGEFNEVSLLVRERTQHYKGQVHSLKLEKIALDMNLKYEKSSLEQKNIQKKIDDVNHEIKSNEKKIEIITHACGLEVKVKYSGKNM